MRFRISAVCLAAGLAAAPVSAVAQAQALRDVVQAMSAHAVKPAGSPSSAAAGRLNAQQATQFEAFLARTPVHGAPQTSPPVSAAPGGIAVSAKPAASVTPDPAAVQAVLALTPPDARAAVAAHGLASGQAVHPYLPSASDFGHQASQAIVAAFRKPKGQTAEDQAQAAAADATPDDPAFDERVTLATTLFQVDGTEAVIRHYVDTEHMKLIITEVGNHIDISKLSETDKYRLASIAAVAQTELEDKIIAMNARVEAANLSKDELMQLIVAYDNDAQRKQTDLRLHDDGKSDQIAGIDVVISEYTILRDFLSAQ